MMDWDSRLLFIQAVFYVAFWKVLLWQVSAAAERVVINGVAQFDIMCAVQVGDSYDGFGLRVFVPRNVISY